MVHTSHCLNSCNGYALLLERHCITGQPYLDKWGLHVIAFYYQPKVNKPDFKHSITIHHPLKCRRGEAGKSNKKTYQDLRSLVPRGDIIRCTWSCSEIIHGYYILLSIQLVTGPFIVWIHKFILKGNTVTQTGKRPFLCEHLRVLIREFCSGKSQGIRKSKEMWLVWKVLHSQQKRVVVQEGVQRNQTEKQEVPQVSEEHKSA